LKEDTRSGRFGGELREKKKKEEGHCKTRQTREGELVAYGGIWEQSYNDLREQERILSEAPFAGHNSSSEVTPWSISEMSRAGMNFEAEGSIAAQDDEGIGVLRRKESTL